MRQIFMVMIIVYQLGLTFIVYHEKNKLDGPIQLVLLNFFSFPSIHPLSACPSAFRLGLSSIIGDLSLTARSVCRRTSSFPSAFFSMAAPVLCDFPSGVRRRRGESNSTSEDSWPLTAKGEGGGLSSSRWPPLRVSFCCWKACSCSAIFWSTLVPGGVCVGVVAGDEAGLAPMAMDPSWVCRPTCWRMYSSTLCSSVRCGRQIHICH